jgi:hypothetical protein
LIEADSEMRAKKRRRFALINIPLFSKAIATAAATCDESSAASAKAGF